MNLKPEYRKAEAKDLEFLIEAILEAEKSSGAQCANQIILGLTEAEYRELILKIFRENVPGSEYCIDSYSLALLEGQKVGAVAAWLEGSGMEGSGMLKAQLLAHFAGREAWIKGQADFSLLSSVYNPRRPGSIQIEAGYILPEYRGQSIPPGMNRFAIDQIRALHPGAHIVQVSSIIENEKSVRTLLKTGFREVARRQSDQARIKELIPGTGFIQFELELEPTNQ